MTSHLEEFRHEWSSPDGFVGSVIEGGWDMAKFSRIESLMRAVCQQLEHVETVDRWIITAFYDVCIWVPQQIEARPSTPGPPGYYKAATDRLAQIYHWFCLGESMYLPEHTWDSL